MLEGVICLLILKLGDALANETVELGASFLVYEASALQGLFCEIRKMKEELESMQAFFRTAEQFKDTDETTVAFVKQIRGLAFNIEDVIDKFTYKLGEDREGMFLLKAIRRVRQIKTWYRLASDLRAIKADLKSAVERSCRYDLKSVERDIKLTRVGSSNRRSAESVHFKRADDLVGIAENRGLLMKWMKDEEQHLIITVWGMGGVGKTTLAAHVYNAIKTDFDTDPDDFRSKSGYVFTLNGGAVSCKSSKQDTVADSTTEVEYIAASEAAKENVWIRKFVIELGVIPSVHDPMELLCDNNDAIAQAKEPRSYQKNKHIQRRFHLIRQFVEEGDVKICKIHTDLNIADPLTKALPQAKHDQHRNAIGVKLLIAS